ncbi:MAG: hypothetical protein Q8R81_08175, partial [Novosphingobium sp.]|uniref:hypothetical protein n=1 Tax=Novosphingobium sp. TaxID=1874826 RepID=UPI0027328777
AVRELEFRDRSGFPLGESRPQIKLRGEAVAVDLGGGRTLFALLTGANGDVDYAKRVADREGIWVGEPEGPYIQIGTPKARVVQIWPRPPYPGNLGDHEDQKRGHALQYPMLVTFQASNDPKTAMQIDPDNLAAIFGPGVRLRRIAIQATDEAVTVGIDMRLKWLNNYHDKMLDGSLINKSRNLENNLSKATFQVGEKK